MPQPGASVAPPAAPRATAPPQAFPPPVLPPAGQHLSATEIAALVTRGERSSAPGTSRRRDYSTNAPPMRATALRRFGWVRLSIPFFSLVPVSAATPATPLRPRPGIVEPATSAMPPPRNALKTWNDSRAELLLSGCRGLTHEEGFDFPTHRIVVGAEKVDEDHRHDEGAGGADQRRIIGSGKIVYEAAEKPPDAGAEAEDHETVAIDLAERPLSDIARHQKRDQVDLGAEPQAQQNYPIPGRAPEALIRGMKPAIGARKNTVATKGAKMRSTR